MDAVPLGQDIDLASPHQAEGRGCGRRGARGDVVGEIVESSSHLGLGRPEEDIGDEEVPWNPPFAPCVVQRSRRWVIQQATGSRRMVDKRPGSNRG
jgi:hypothetical protein